MIEEIKQFKNKLEEILLNEETRSIVESEGFIKTVSNAHLLADDLISFYQNESSKYFPNCISNEIKNYITDSISQLTNLLAKNLEQNKALYQNLDNLYASCLKSGITTFGFDLKNLTKLLENSKKTVQGLQEKVWEAEKEIQSKKLEAQSLVQESAKNINSIFQKEKEEFTAKLNILSNTADKDTQSFKENIESSRQVILGNVNEGNKLIKEISQINNYATEHQTNIKKIFDDCQPILGAIQTTLKNGQSIKTSIDNEFKNAQTITATMQGNLNSLNQSLADVITKKQEAINSVTHIEQRKLAVDDFYKNIEKSKEELLQIKKTTDANFNELTNNYTKEIEDFSRQTKKIIETNQEYGKEIDETLRKAVTAGLFGAFNKRQRFLSITRFIWAGFVFASAIGLAISVFILAKSIDTNNGVSLDKAFVIRTGMIIPLGWLIYFAGSQYKKERHAEEEYGYKL